MSQSLHRFSISMRRDLLAELDEMATARGYANRSQAIADMTRSQLIEHRSQQGRRVIAGTITLVYDHHKRNIQSLLTTIQHDHGNQIIATMHAHLDHHNCLEVLVVKGQASQVKSLADRLISCKGVKHGRLTVTTTGEEFTK
jgi:CopG family transcriptional regulator, nickel-responsive regulator